MARPRKPRRDPDKPARSREQIMELHRIAREFYLDTGGGDIDVQIDALEYTARAYRSQMNAIEHDGRELNAWGPDVTTYEARMSAGRAAALIRLREQKMQQCMVWAEEAQEAAAAASTPKAEQPAPEPTEAPEPVQQQPAPEPEQPAPQPAAKAGKRKPLQAGQPLTGEESEEELLKLLEEMEAKMGLPVSAHGLKIPALKVPPLR